MFCQQPPGAFALSSMRFCTAALVLLLLPSIALYAQPASPPASATAANSSSTAAAGQGTPAQNTIVLTDSLNALQPAIDNLHQTLAGLNVNKWKAPGDVRGQMQSDVDSMQRDLNGTLPDLLTKARAASSSVSPSFAVFRNVDALYDVLLRVTETATLAGAQGAGSLEQARATLEQARAQLGSALLQQSQAQDAEVVQLRTTAAAAAAAVQQAAPKKTVVDDGPVTTKPKPARRKRPPTTPAPEAAPQQ
jgi:hypothetical protein